MLGYHIIYFDLDTQGYLLDDPTLIQTSKDIWDEAVDDSDSATDSFLNIEHDIHYQSVYNLTDYFLSSLFKHGYKPVTVGECLGDPAENWYRAGPGQSGPIQTPTQSSSTTPTSSASPTATPPTEQEGPFVSEDGQCGPESNQSCFGSSFGECCSSSGKCSTSTLSCLSILGCQADYGQCI